MDTGIRCGSIIQHNVRIACQTNVNDEEEAVQIILRHSDSSPNLDTNDCLRENIKYGAGKPDIDDLHAKEEACVDSGDHSD
jgi:hypothetical protein